ncbi:MULTISPECIES: DUF2442 domain-containing protein [Methylococcus]|uniref:DUF2442 domain-containing protein n=1 Tax=Methylococcus capsulatus TaxID=414 RepID=A0ABZ2F7D1_METCP|nr:MULTISPECIES: DUF2442 domain-containing protein [Methylococcus]MDF9393712.1 DUF2442 domain-containing protein [Methylococcus capsulatus]
MTPDVVEVKALPEYTLLVRFANGELRRFDMRPYLRYPAFAHLQDPALFQSAHVQHGTVAWTNDIDVSPDTLYLRGETAGVTA